MAVLFPWDIIEHNGNYRINIDLPGYKKEDIIIQAKYRCLSITAQKSDKPEGAVIRTTRFERRFAQEFTLGDDVGITGIAAEYINGVLTLTLPIKEGMEPLTIKVN